MSSTPPLLDSLAIELLIMVAKSCDTTFGPRDICSLRRTSKRAATALLPLAIKRRVLDIYLDQDGVANLQSLATNLPELVTHICKVTIGIRKIGNDPLVMRKESRTFIEYGDSQTEERELNSVKSFATGLKHIVGSVGFQWHSVLTAAQREGYVIELEHSGSGKGCVMLGKSTDYAPSKDIFTAISKALLKFNSLKSISANEETKHRMIIVKDSRKQEVDRLLVHDRGGQLWNKLEKPRCECKLGRAIPQQKTCLSIDTMSASLLDHFSIFRIAIIDHHDRFSDSALGSRLTSFCIDFFNRNRPGRSHVETPQLKALISFLLSCKNLTHLRLSTIPKHAQGNLAAAPIALVLIELLKRDWSPPLEKLWLSCVDPISESIVKFIKQFAKHLKHIDIAIPTQPARKFKGVSKSQRMELWSTLAGIEGLSCAIRNYNYAHDWYQIPTRAPNPRRLYMPDTIVDASALPSLLDKVIREIAQETNDPWVGMSPL